MHARQTESRSLKVVSLFAGSGGWERGLSLAQLDHFFRVTQLVEINPDAQFILRSHYPDIPIHSDIRDYQPRSGEFDLFTISFPCTETSGAGKRTGLDHPESALWREALRCICICRPKFVAVEQPEGFINRGLRECLGGLRMAGYRYDDPLLVSAAEVGAMHQRNRLFVVSYLDELQFLHEPTSWNDQVREVVQGTRDSSRWLSVERPSNGSIVGIPGGLVQSAVAAPAKHPGRIRARYLAGRTVTPAQAAVVWRRLVYLARLCCHYDAGRGSNADAA